MSLLVATSATPPSTRGNNYPTQSAYASTAPTAAVAPENFNTGGQMAQTRLSDQQANTFSTNLGSAYQAGTLAAQPTQDQLQLQNNYDYASLANMGQQYQNTVGYDQNTYNNNVASNNLNALGNLAQQAAIPREVDYSNNTYANQVGRYNDQTAYIGQQYGFNNTDLAQTTGYLGTSGTLADQLQQIQGQGAGITQSDAIRAARTSAEAGGGSTTSRGYNDNLGSANQTYANSLAGYANTNAGTHNSLNYQLGQANLNYSEKNADLGDQQSSLNHGIFQNAMDTNEKNSQLNDNLGQLRLAGAQLGINATQLQQSLNYTLNNLNLSNQMDAGKVMTDIGSNDAQTRQNALNVFYQAVANAQGH